MSKKQTKSVQVTDAELLAAYQARMTYPIREVSDEEFQDANKREEYLENVMFAQHTYRVKRKDGRDVMLVPIPRDEKMVDVRINISLEDFAFLSKEAHRRDVTFNQLVAILLSRYIDKDIELKSSVKKKKKKRK